MVTDELATQAGQRTGDGEAVKGVLRMTLAPRGRGKPGAEHHHDEPNHADRAHEP